MTKYGHQVSLGWEDEEGDSVSIGSEQELALALASMQGRLAGAG